ncbi:MAG: arylesterase [Paracoccaceae bacterium]
MHKTILTIVFGLSGPVAAEPVVIAALGDSLTHGYGLAQGDGFVPQLEAWLGRHGEDVKLINAGVSGDTTAGGLSRVAWTLTDDVDAMIVTLGGNDLLRGISPDTSRANLQGILMAAKDADVKVLLVGMEAPGNFGPEYKSEFDSIYPDLSMAFGTLYLDSFFSGLGGRGIDPSSIQNMMQADGIHPNAEGVVKIVEGFGPIVMELIDAVQD